MRTFTTKHTVYEFKELSEDAKQKALENLADVNVELDWWDFTEDDAKQIGLNITEFDTYRRTINGELTEGLQTVCKAILAEHGDSTATYQLAVKWQNKHGEDNEEQFKKALLEEYLSILEKEFEYLTSEESIIETIEDNEYEFYEDGRLA